jgi:hypothetical protein
MMRIVSLPPRQSRKKDLGDGSREMPRDMLGRVSSIDFLVSYGAALLAFATLPVVVVDFDQNLSLLVAGVTVLVVPLMALALTSATALQKLHAPGCPL